jgi:acyl-CoA reductase-like NAD-dependent aldehyde dehydrogenase
VKDEKAAIAEANKTGLGLGASIWTRDIKKAEKLAKDIEAGFVSINKIVRSDPRLPFGGIKESGYGRELSEYGIKEFVNIKSIVVERAKK